MNGLEVSTHRKLREELIRAVRARAETVLGHFYREHFPAVYRFVICRLNGDHAEAEEVVSDVFFQAFRDIESYDGVHAPGVWLQGIARHRVLDARRRKERRAGRELNAGPDGQGLRDVPDLETAELPDAALENKELLAQVEQVLSALPADYEQVLRLHYVEDLPVKELADKLGVSFKTAEARLFRARQEFREAFRRQSGEGGG